MTENVYQEHTKTSHNWFRQKKQFFKWIKGLIEKMYTNGQWSTWKDIQHHWSPGKYEFKPKWDAKHSWAGPNLKAWQHQLWEEMGETNSCGAGTEMAQGREKTVWQFLVKFNHHVLYDPAIQLQGIYPPKRN